MSLRVSADGTADYSAISDAIQAAADNEVINVAPGTYSESVIIKKPLTLAGDGPRDQIIIQSNSPTCINIEAGKCVIKGLTLSNEKHKSEDDKHFTVNVNNAEVFIEDCNITGASLACIGVQGSSANATIKNCVIHDSAEQSGIYFDEESRGTADGCKIHNNASHGISVKQSHVTVQNSTIESNDSGIYIIGSEVNVINCKIRQNTWEAFTAKENSSCNISESDLTYNGGEGAFGIDDSSSLTENSNKLELTEKEILARIKAPESEIYRDIEPYLKHDSEKIKLHAKLTLFGRDDCYYRLLSDFATDENPKVRLGTAKHSMSDLVILNQLKNDKDSAVKKYVSSVLPQRKKAENLADAIVKWLKKCQDSQLEGFNEEEDICEAFITIYDAGKKNTPGKYCEEFSFGNSVEFDDLVLDLQQFLYRNFKSKKKYCLAVQYRYLYEKMDIEFGEFIVDFTTKKITTVGTWNITNPKCSPVLINKVLQVPDSGGPYSEQNVISEEAILIKALQNPAVSAKSITEFWNWAYEESNHWENFSDEEINKYTKMIDALCNNPAIKSYLSELTNIDDPFIREQLSAQNILKNKYADEWDEWSDERYKLVKNLDTPVSLYSNLFRDKWLITKVLDEFDKLNVSLQQKIISCIRELDFEKEGHWRVFKSLYKASEKALIKELLIELLLRLDAMERSFDNWETGVHGWYPRALWIGESTGKGPTWRTVIYMKRRGRRFMKKLADENPDLYIELAYALITHSQGYGPWKWISHDTLLGRSPRFLHTRHGRGEVKQIVHDGFLHRFDERTKNKDLWNGKADELKDLLEQKDDLSCQTEEFIVKILHRTQSGYPFQDSDPKTIQPDRIKGWFANSSVWLKYLAGKGAERLFNEPVIIAEKQAGGSLMIASSMSDIFANMLFYAGADTRTALYESAVKSYPIPSFDHHLFDLDNNPVIASLVQHFNLASLLNLAEAQDIHNKTAIPLQVCEEMVNDAKSNSLANSLWLMKDTEGKEVKYLFYLENGMIETIEENNENVEPASLDKKGMDYLKTALDQKCPSKKLVDITDDSSIPWTEPEAEDLLAAICSNPNTPSDRLATTIDLFGKNPKVCLGIAVNPKQSTGLKGKWIAVRLTRDTTVGAAQDYLLMKFYFEFLKNTLELLKSTLHTNYLTQRSIQVVKLITDDQFSGYFANKQLRELVLEISNRIFHFQNPGLNNLSDIVLAQYPEDNVQYSGDEFSFILRWLEAAINGTDKQIQTAAERLSCVIENIELEDYSNILPFLDNKSQSISNFIWSGSSQYPQSIVPHKIWSYVLEKPDDSDESKWVSKSMGEIGAVTKLSNALQSPLAKQLLSDILQEELKKLKHDVDPTELTIYPIFEPSLMVYLISKKIPEINNHIFKMIDYKMSNSEPIVWLPVIVDHMNLFSKSEQKMVKIFIVDTLRSNEDISLDWFFNEKSLGFEYLSFFKKIPGIRNFIVEMISHKMSNSEPFELLPLIAEHMDLFNKTEQKKIKALVINNLKGREHISLDWYFNDEYLVFFNDIEQKMIEKYIIHSYKDYQFNSEYYSEHPLRRYMLHPFGYKGDDLDEFGARLFNAVWEIADIGILESYYIEKFINELETVSEKSIKIIVIRICGLTNKQFQSEIIQLMINTYLFEDIDKILTCPTSLIKLMVDSLSLDNVKSLLNTAKSEVWKILRPYLLKRISKPDFSIPFWKSVLEYLTDNENSVVLRKVKNSSGNMVLEGGKAWINEVIGGRIIPASLYTRTLRDPVFLDKLYAQTDPFILSIENTMFNEEVLNWVKHNEKIFKADSAELVKVATHKIPDVRKWGLRKSEQMGMKLPFAVKLIECSLPDSQKTGKKFFIDSPKKTKFTNILALCDSPIKRVRDYGVSLMNGFNKELLDSSKLEMMAENTDAGVLTFVAKELLQTDEYQQFIQIFDKIILFQKDKNRKVKELIKKRIEKKLLIDPEILNQLAIGNNKQDSDWALVQLTRLSIQGENIKNLEIQDIK